MKMFFSLLLLGMVACTPDQEKPAAPDSLKLEGTWTGYYGPKPSVELSWHLRELNNIIYCDSNTAIVFGYNMNGELVSSELSLIYLGGTINQDSVFFGFDSYPIWHNNYKLYLFSYAGIHKGDTLFLTQYFRDQRTAVVLYRK